MKTWKAALAVGLLAGGAAVGAGSAAAQGTTFPDVPANHWAYQAVQDLADKGYVKGYPDGKFLGKRALTRYEFATVIDRMVQTISDLSSKVSGGAVTTPTGTPVTQDDLNKIQVLVDGFKTQLDAIQSQIGPAQPGGVSLQDEIDALRSDLLDTQANVTKAQAAADNSFGIGGSRKFQISGYVQARYQQAGKSQGYYPSGTSSKAGSYNGNYATGGNTDSFEVRRARLKFTGAITPNSKFGIQIDTSGAVTAGASPNQQVTVREGYVAYTFGDGSAQYPTITAGQFATPFGYQLPASTSATITPERPLAFSEAGYGLFANQDYDKGVQFGYNTPQQLVGFLPGGLKLTVALINGTGRTSEEVDRHIDSIYRVAYASPDKQLGVGVSYYLGQLPGTGTGVAYQKRKKQLFGADAQYFSTKGPFILGEYVAGEYEQRNFLTFTPSTGYNSGALTNAFAPGNRVEGYYGQVGYAFGATTDKPLSLFVSYDKLRRATSGAGSSGSYNDENVGYGASYNLDKATRLRLYYVRPQKVAHAPTSPNPEKISETIGELQVKF